MYLGTRHCRAIAIIATTISQCFLSQQHLSVVGQWRVSGVQLGHSCANYCVTEAFARAPLPHHCRAIAIRITRAAWREKCLVCNQKTLDDCERFGKQWQQLSVFAKRELTNTALPKGNLAMKSRLHRASKPRKGGVETAPKVRPQRPSKRSAHGVFVFFVAQSAVAFFSA